MLLKLIFTLLGIIWLMQALRPYLSSPQNEKPRYTPPPRPDNNPPPPARKTEAEQPRNIEDEYIDYEEIK